MGKRIPDDAPTSGPAEPTAADEPPPEDQRRRVIAERIDDLRRLIEVLRRKLGH